MNYTASQKIAKTSVTPVANAPQLPKNLTPGFYSAYDAMYSKQKADQRKKEQKDSTLPEKQSSNADAGQPEFPEIFELLQKYRFKDFLQLMLSGDDAQMMFIIKKKRTSRGIKRSSSLSSGHRKSNEFINRKSSEYRKANWLMEVKPGKAYTGTL